MYKFNYVTKSRDGRMTGNVSADYVARVIMTRSVDGVGTADSGKWIELHMSDGSKVKFVLNDLDAEVQYYLPG